MTQDAVIEWSDRALCTAPQVTVHIHTYNHERYLDRALESVCRQRTSFPFEVVVGEDCSSDSTRQIAQAWLARCPEKIRVITGPRNIGSRGNYLRAARRARGNFVAICEGDDYWIDDSKLQRQAAALQSHPEIDLCFHSHWIRNDALGRLSGPEGRSRRGNTTVSVADVIRGGGGYMATASLMMRRSVIEALPAWFETEATPGDYVWQVLAARRGGALYLDRPMAVYRTGVPGSWSSTMQDLHTRVTFQRAYGRLLTRLAAEAPECGSAFADHAADHFIGVACQGIRSRSHPLVEAALEQLATLRLDRWRRLKAACLRWRAAGFAIAGSEWLTAAAKRAATRHRRVRLDPGRLTAEIRQAAAFVHQA